MSDDRPLHDDVPLSEMTFTEAFDVERAQCESSEAAMGRLAGRYAAGYAYEYDRAAKLEAELATAQKIIEAREAQIAHLQAPDDRPLAEQVRQEAPEGGGFAEIIGAGADLSDGNGARTGVSVPRNDDGNGTAGGDGGQDGEWQA